MAHRMMVMPIRLLPKPPLSHITIPSSARDPITRIIGATRAQWRAFRHARHQP
ncbi:hypothetical protein M3J09_013837 [Ascochyta lentis]